MANIKGNFCQWFEVLIYEGYSVKQAKKIAWQNIQLQCPLPDWYVEEKGITVDDEDSDMD